MQLQLHHLSLLLPWLLLFPSFPLVAAECDMAAFAAAFAAAQATCSYVAVMRQSASMDVVYHLVGEVYLYGVPAAGACCLPPPYF
jgi:hypothetical protein